MQHNRIPLSYHARATLTLGLPLIGSSLAQMSLHVVNTVMVGWYGIMPLAALVLAASSYFIIFVVGSGFARAVMPLAADAKARNDEAGVRRVARMGLWLSLGFGLLVYPLFWFSEALLLSVDQIPEIAHEAQRYLRWAGLGLLPALAVAVLQGWLAALGRTQVVLWVTLVAVGINVVLNWFLIFGNGGLPELGVAGAGLASCLVQFISVIVLAVYAAKGRDLGRYRMWRRFWVLDRQAIRDVFSLGWPISLTGLAESGMFQASALMMGWVGASQLAAHGIALEATALGFMCHVGLSNAATVRVAEYSAQGNARAVRDAALVAIGISLIFGIFVVALFLLWPEHIVGLFLNMSRPDSAQIVAFGVVLLAVAALFQFADAMQVMALGLLRGLQDTKVPMIYASISYWIIGIPGSYILAFVLGFGGVGLWFGLVMGLVVAAISLMWRFWHLAPKPSITGEDAL